MEENSEDPDQTPHDAVSDLALTLFAYVNHHLQYIFNSRKNKIWRLQKLKNTVKMKTPTIM